MVKFFHHLAFLIPCPRWLDRRFAAVLAMAFCLMAAGLHVATPNEIARIGSGNFAASWQMIVILLAGSVLLGLAFGVMEARTVYEIVSTLSLYSWAAHAQNLISGLSIWLRNLLANGLVSLLVGLTSTIERFDVTFEPLPTVLTSHCWTTGTTPLIHYEDAA